jgi:hypothetical protein
LSAVNMSSISPPPATNIHLLTSPPALAPSGTASAPSPTPSVVPSPPPPPPSAARPFAALSRGLFLVTMLALPASSLLSLL